MKPPIVIVVEHEPTGRSRASVDGIELCVSREPFLDAARVLLANGTPRDTPIVMRRHGSDVDCLRSTIRAAARLTVVEDGRGTRFARWKAPPRGMDRSSIARNGY